MDSKLPLFLPLLFFVAHFHHSLSASGKTISFESVPDLEKSMYTQIDGYPCVRLLNISGEIGCSRKVVTPIVQFKNADVLVRSTAVLVSADEFESLLSRYVPAYSTRLKYESGGWTLLPYNSSDIMSMEDPVWSESNWDTIGIRVYTVQDPTYDRLILVLGIVITLLAYLLITLVRTLIRKALKQD